MHLDANYDYAVAEVQLTEGAKAGVEDDSQQLRCSGPTRNVSHSALLFPQMKIPSTIKLSERHTDGCQRTCKVRNNDVRYDDYAAHGLRLRTAACTAPHWQILQSTFRPKKTDLLSIRRAKRKIRMASPPSEERK